MPNKNKPVEEEYEDKSLIVKYPVLSLLVLLIAAIFVLIMFFISS